MSSKKGLAPWVAIVFLSMAGASAAAGAIGATGAEDRTVPSTTSMTSAQIVDQMQLHNRSRAEELKHYQAVRHYQVDYKGFGANLGARMEVEVTYDSPSAKTFRIVSQSGSKILIDKVLKRLVETEKEAERNKGTTALTAANYRFRLEGSETLDGRPAYVLSVEPLTENKLLYRGKIWVDAADFAVARIDAEPAKNPSFWIAKTEVHHTYSRNGGSWLPQQNRSESKIRIGGAAVLTIDYGTYKIGTEPSRQAAGN
jgi:hypothetical protein